MRNISLSIDIQVYLLLAPYHQSPNPRWVMSELWPTSYGPATTFCDKIIFLIDIPIIMSKAD